MKAKVTLLALSFMFFSFYSTKAQLPILSGPSQGSYYQFISNLENVLTFENKKLVTNIETNGAAFNFEQLADLNSPYKLALTQSDFLYTKQALDMLNNTEKTKNIKVILPLANEEIHLVTLSGSGIKGLKDLTHKMVAIGTQYQGTYTTSNIIRDQSKVNWTSKNTSFENALGELGRKEIDAFFIVGSSPLEKLDIIPQVIVDGLALVPLHDFNDWAKYYQNDTIRAGEYRWLEKDVPTFGVKTLLIINDAKLTDQDKENIDLIIKGIRTNLDKLKAEGHPKWKEVDLSDWDSSDWPLYE
jgi:TRAP transporter TAXI family solute receptor